MDTKGWDAVFVSSINRINKQLKTSMNQLIATFDFQKDNIRFQGTFGPWQVTKSGANQLLRFETPMTQLTMELTFKDGTVNRQTFHNIIPVMEMQLAFIDNQNNDHYKDLKFNCKVVGQAPGDQTPGAVTTVNPDTTNQINNTNEDTEVAWGLLNRYLPLLYIDNQSKLAYVFSQVNLAPPSSSSWISPKKFKYLYLEPTGGQKGFLAVLAVTSDRDISRLPMEVDGSLLDTPHEVFVMISEGLFLEHIMMPSLPEDYGHGATAGNFLYQPLTNTSGHIVNNGSLSAGSIRVGLVDYNPYIESLNITIDNDTAVTSLNGKFDITGLLNAYVTYSMSARNKFQYDAVNNRITFLKDNNPQTNYENHVPWYDYMFALIGSVIVLAVVDAVIAIVSDSIAKSVSDSVVEDGNNSLTKASAIAVSWNGLEEVKVQDVGLQQAFYLRGCY